MPRERTLLERLQRPEEDLRPTIHENTARLRESVLANLRRLLNSRHGIAPIQELYGIPDLCDVIHNFPEAVGAMRKAIKTSIETYEPRLKKVTVTHVEAPDEVLSLRFEIKAELITEEDRESVWIETRIDSKGAVAVKG